MVEDSDGKTSRVAAVMVTTLLQMLRLHHVTTRRIASRALRGGDVVRRAASLTKMPL